MRQSWQKYFMRLACQIATRATCDRKHVGAVIVRNNIILTTGYNGSMRGVPHCDDVGHMMENGHCAATIHAEINTIIQAAKNGIMIDNSEIYVTAFPCWNCFKALVNVGVKKIYYSDDYRVDEKVLQTAKELGIVIECVSFDDDFCGVV
jgi:dCMP deaminase